MVVVSFYPKVIPTYALRALSLTVHLFFIPVMCCLNDIDVLYETPSILDVVYVHEVLECCLW